MDKPFIIETDASLVRTGAILYQKNQEQIPQPCAYISHSLNPAQQRYEIYDRELLAVIRALKMWQHYLLHSPYPVMLWTDHKNLLFFKEVHKLTPRQVQWQQYLDQFNLVMEHKEGTKMIPSDILSRRPDFEQAPNVERALFPQLATLNIDELYEQIKEAQKEDTKLPSNCTQKLPMNSDDIL